MEDWFNGRGEPRTGWRKNLDGDEWRKLNWVAHMGYNGGARRVENRTPRFDKSAPRKDGYRFYNM